MDPITVYCVLAAAICGLVSVVELLDRYGHSTRVTTVLWNMPAVFYIGINVAVGALAVAVANAAGSIVLDTAHIGAISLLKSAGVGAAALATLRSNLATLSTGGERKMGLGPSAVLDKIKEYLDRKIDLLHKLKVDKVISMIMKDVDARKARVDLQALCLAGVKRCTKEEIADVKKTIDDLFKLETLPVTRAMMMGHALYKLCGLEVLESSVEMLGARIKFDPVEKNDETTAEADLAVKLKAAKVKLLERG